MLGYYLASIPGLLRTSSTNERSAASSANEIGPALQRWVNESVRTESRQGQQKIRSVIEIVGIRIKVNRLE